MISRTDCTEENISFVKEFLDYNPETGAFIWKAPRRKIQVGAEAGSLCASGYIKIRVGDRRYRAHRLAFLFMEGYFPEVVDHINGERSDNRWCNLRAVSHTENRKNQPNIITHGVYLDLSTGLWVARGIKKTRCHVNYPLIGKFSCPLEAKSAFEKWHR